ncbi:MAG: hypothetical protein ACRDP4_15100, partial [Nocardioidaceae bacterium]
QRDPMFEALDRVAGIADTDPVDDRMPGIKRRVRVSRRRKGAGIAVAAAALVVAGASIWQAVPTTRTAPPASGPQTTQVNPPPTTPWQKVSVHAQAQGSDHLRISYVVTGKSSAYTAPETGDPVDAGPRLTDVRVDGKPVGGSDGGALACKPGGTLSSYTEKFHTDKPLVVPVSPGGKHTVVVKAPYCADGHLAHSTKRVVVTMPPTGFTVADRATADVDGDGTDDVVRLLVPKDTGGEHQLLRVTWGTGGSATATLDNTMTSQLTKPVDLDHDGDLEIIVVAGGGDMQRGYVFVADAGSLQRVQAVDASGQEVRLQGDTNPAAWQTYFGPDGIYSYRLTDPSTTDFPAPVEVRTWSLAGHTLTQSAKTTSECMSLHPKITFGPC